MPEMNPETPSLEIAHTFEETNLTDPKKRAVNPLKILPVSLKLRIGTYDIDFAGVVSNIVYIRWLEDLRLRFMEVHYPLEEATKKRTVPLISRLKAHYIQPLRMFDEPLGTVWIEKLGRVRFTMGAEILKEGQKAFEAIQEGCFIHTETKAVLPIPEELHRLSSFYGKEAP